MIISVFAAVEGRRIREKQLDISWLFTQKKIASFKDLITTDRWMVSRKPPETNPSRPRPQSSRSGEDSGSERTLQEL